MRRIARVWIRCFDPLRYGPEALTHEPSNRRSLGTQASDTVLHSLFDRRNLHREFGMIRGRIFRCVSDATGILDQVASGGAHRLSQQKLQASSQRKTVPNTLMVLTALRAAAHQHVVQASSRSELR